MMADDQTFRELLDAQNTSGNHLCVGLDTHPSRLPAGFRRGDSPEARVASYNQLIVEATCDLVAAYKPNVAFYEALGTPGLDALASTISHIARTAPQVPVILDAKRGDIEATNEGYVRAAFDELGAHAITVHPYLGGASLAPFLDRAERGVFVLARTSNAGAGELQDLPIDGLPLYRHVARRVARDWNRHGNCGLVVGATYPEELGLIREDVGADMPILVPGVGAQGGDLQAAVRANRGSAAFVINASRSILYAQPAKEDADDDFAAAARRAVESVNSAIRDVLR
jgi:orotidine-5'-phosphate decarboxylase